jgi:hypothetical protein
MTVRHGTYFLTLPFGFAGELADKVLARAVKKDDKRKAEKSKDKDKPKGKKPAYRIPRYPPYNPYGGYGGYGGYGQPQWPQQYPPMGQQGGGFGYGARPDPKACSFCKQPGHYFRNCPSRPAPSAALGAAPK